MIIHSRMIRRASLVVLSLLISSLVLFAQKGDAGRLKTKVNPGRAGIFIDGKYLGPAANFGMARTYSLPAGEHELLLTEPRYKDFTTKIKIEAGKTTVLSQSLEALPTPKPP